MNRESVKFIAENCVQLKKIITDGGLGTFVKFNGITIDQSNIDNFILNIDIMEAYLNGAQIQYKHYYDEEWCGLAEPSFISPFEYRVKPEPREFVIAYSKRTGAPVSVMAGLETKEYPNANLEYIKVREIV